MFSVPDSMAIGQAIAVAPDSTLKPTGQRSGDFIEVEVNGQKGFVPATQLENVPVSLTEVNAVYWYQEKALIDSAKPLAVNDKKSDYFRTDVPGSSFTVDNDSRISLDLQVGNTKGADVSAGLVIDNGRQGKDMRQIVLVKQSNGVWYFGYYDGTKGGNNNRIYAGVANGDKFEGTLEIGRDGKSIAVLSDSGKVLKRFNLETSLLEKGNTLNLQVQTGNGSKVTVEALGLEKEATGKALAQFEANSDLTVRGGPGSGYSIVDKAKAGDIGVVIGQGEGKYAGWYKVKLKDGSEGWIQANAAKVLSQDITISAIKNVPALPPAPATPDAARPKKTPEAPKDPYRVNNISELNLEFFDNRDPSLYEEHGQLFYPISGRIDTGMNDAIIVIDAFDGAGNLIPDGHKVKNGSEAYTGYSSPWPYKTIVIRVYDSNGNLVSVSGDNIR